MNTETELDIAEEVRSLYDLMRNTDPGAYRGFVSDAAIRAVAKKHGRDWREVLKAYRAKYPVSGGPTRFDRPIPAGARQANPEALAFRDAYLKETPWTTDRESKTLEESSTSETSASD